MKRESSKFSDPDIFSRIALLRSAFAGIVRTDFAGAARSALAAVARGALTGCVGGSDFLPKDKKGRAQENAEHGKKYSSAQSRDFRISHMPYQIFEPHFDVVTQVFCPSVSKSRVPSKKGQSFSGLPSGPRFSGWTEFSSF